MLTIPCCISNSYIITFEQQRSCYLNKWWKRLRRFRRRDLFLAFITSQYGCAATSNLQSALPLPCAPLREGVLPPSHSLLFLGKRTSDHRLGGNHRHSRGTWEPGFSLCGRCVCCASDERVLLLPTEFSLSDGARYVRVTWSLRAR